MARAGVRLPILQRMMGHADAATTLHYIRLSMADIAEEALARAYHRLRKNAAVGVDGVTKEQYGKDLEANLRDLHERLRTKRYRHQPIRRVHLPKEGGATRPIGVSATEDKGVQGALREVLEAVYEQDFRDCSYGFRPKRSAHQALDVFREQTMQMRGGWVIKVDIKSYFDTISHPKLRAILDKRVRDGVIRRTIDKWLKAGVMLEGVHRQTVAGTPQGGVISPLLRTVVTLGHELGMTVVAEGIETQEHFEAMRALGCDIGQGFLFSRPLPYERLEAWFGAQTEAEPTPMGEVRRLRAVP